MALSPQLKGPNLMTLTSTGLRAAADRLIAAATDVLSGALGPMVPVRPGSEYAAQIDTIGSVEVSFAEVTP